VTAIDVRPGGRIGYVMSASEPEMTEFLERQGQALATEQVLTIREAASPRRLVTTNVVGVTLDSMHDQHWTEMATKGWEGQLENLARVVAEKRPGSRRISRRGPPLPRRTRSGREPRA
jgi:hypothetical protein